MSQDTRKTLKRLMHTVAGGVSTEGTILDRKTRRMMEKRRAADAAKKEARSKS